MPNLLWTNFMQFYIWRIGTVSTNKLVWIWHGLGHSTIKENNDSFLVRSDLRTNIVNLKMV